MVNGRDPWRVAEACAELAAVAEAIAAQVLGVPFDVTDSGAVRRGVARAEDEAGPLDILVNNAGDSTGARSPTSPTRTGTGCSIPT